jgi:hypothetical protein
MSGVVLTNCGLRCVRARAKPWGTLVNVTLVVETSGSLRHLLYKAHEQAGRRSNIWMRCSAG